MRIKSLALATTLSLLSTSALVGSVHAQKGVTLQPQSSWAVKRVNADTPNAYCALARRFEQGLILTLAKNDKHEISFAIDFPQGNFSANQRYQISLDPGAGEQRKFKVKPASSGKAFVARIGSDQKFISALLRTGYLRVVVENESYNFNLADIDQGQEQLEACLYSGMTPAAGNTNAVSVPSYTQLADLRAEKDKLEQRLQKLEQENESLRLRSVSGMAEQGLDTASDKSSALKVTNSPAVDGLLKQIKSLNNENAELKKLAEASKNNAPVSTDVSVVELARENQRLQALLQEQDSADTYKQQVEKLTQRISSLENENLSLAQQKSSGLDSEEKRDLERQILALSSENSALRESIKTQSGANNGDFTAIKEELLGLERENARLNTRVSALMDEKTAVMEQLGYYEDENEKLRNANNSNDTALLAQLREEIRKIESANARSLAQKESEISNLQSDLQALKTEQARAQSSSEDIQRQTEAVFKTQIEALSIKNEALKEELVSLSKGQSLLDSFKNKVETVTQEKLALQDKLDSAQMDIADLQAQLDAQKANKDKNEEDKVALGLQLDGLNAEIADLKQSVSELVNENEILHANLSARSSEDKELKAQIEGHREELASLENENQTLKRELESFTSQNKAKVDKLADLLEQNEELRAQLKAKQAEHQDKVAGLEESLKQLNAANAKLREQRDATVAALEQELADLRRELENVQDEELAALSVSEELALKDTQLVQMRAEVGKQSATLEQKEALLDEKSNSINSLQENVSALENQNKDLVLALDNARTFNEALQKDWSETLASYQALKKQNEGAVLAENEVGSATLAARTDQSEKLEALQRKNKDLSAQLEAQAREYLVLVRDMEALKQHKGETRPQPVSVNADEIDALRTNNKILKGEVDILRQQLADKELPQAREASLRQNEPVLDASARRTREAALEQNQRQSEREEITKLAAIAPAAGIDQNDVVAEIASPSEPSDPVRSGIKEKAAVRNVVDELQMDDSNLSEAQKLERSLKNQIERSARSPALQENLKSASSSSVAIIEDTREPTSQGIKPVEAVIQERIEGERPAPARNVVPIQQSDEKGVFVPTVNVAELLAAANIDLAAPVSLVSNSSGTDRVAYQWRSANDLYGSAHQKQISNINEFDNYVRDYLTMTEERCTGDFAIMPSSTEQVGQTRIDSYEIACVGAGVNSSASVVFFNSDNTFTVLAHEGPTEGMEMAMDARDKIVSMVEKS